MIGVEDEDPVHRLFNCRDHLILLGRDAEGHLQEIAGVAELVVGIDERLADRILIGHGRDRRHLGDQAVAGDLALHRIGNVGRIVVERGKRANHPAHDRHRVSVAAEAPIERGQLFMHHGVAGDGAGEFVQLCLARQFAIEQQIADFHEAGIFRYDESVKRYR